MPTRDLPRFPVTYRRLRPCEHPSYGICRTRTRGMSCEPAVSDRRRPCGALGDLRDCALPSCPAPADVAARWPDDFRHSKQPSGDSVASIQVRLVCRLGGCGPAIVRRTGPHLGGGPGHQDRPRPCRSRPLRARLPPPPALAGASLASRASAARGSGRASAPDRECGRAGPRCSLCAERTWRAVSLADGRHAGRIRATTAQGVTGFDFGS